ncbi:hypothetical protein LN042_00830 [Kitasatospora sp. RB6PN24]|uniref:hypothetical protein n=1 Tax=Kitasatospora humi TaxID=2893891 RepID=UPI001E2E0511|nr:hypothetical protein [Kitasatospora humi]MCC9305665.1 hypothetical protein [Kitasatospora humi]
MSTALLRRGAIGGLRSAAVAALAFATVLGGAVAARADAPGHTGFVLNVKLSTSGVVEAPDQHPGGTVTFRIATDDPNGRQLQIFRPHAGVSMDQVLKDLANAVSQDPPTAAAGVTAVNNEAEALGGGLATPDVPMIVSEDIDPGPIYLLDFTAFFAHPNTPPPVKEIDLCEDKGFHIPHFPHEIVIQKDTPAGPRFQTENVDSASGAIFVHNGSPELHEMQMLPVVPGTTDEQIQAYFDAIAAGQTPPSPFTGPAVGLGVISPNRDAVVHADKLPPGDYALLCFVPDDKTGVPHVFLGMHKVVHLA